MPLDPASLHLWATEALVEKARLTGWRKALYAVKFRLGCLFSLAVVVAAVFLLSRNAAGASIVDYVFIGVLSVILLSPLVWAGIEHWTVRPVRPFIHELKRRFGLLDQVAYEPEEWAVPGRTASILVNATGLPGGHHHWIRIRRFKEGGGDFEAVAGKLGFEFVLGKDPTPEFQCRKVSFSKENLGQLDSLLQRIQFGENEKIPSTVRDGFRCQMMVLGADRGQRASLSCNLMGLGHTAQEMPSVQLLKYVVELDRRLNPRQEVIGACDAFGNITMVNTREPER